MSNIGLLYLDKWSGLANEARTRIVDKQCMHRQGHYCRSNFDINHRSDRRIRSYPVVWLWYSSRKFDRSNWLPKLVKHPDVHESSLPWSAPEPQLAGTLVHEGGSLDRRMLLRQSTPQYSFFIASHIHANRDQCGGVAHGCC